MARDRYDNPIDPGDIVKGKVLEKGLEVEKLGIVQRVGNCPDCQVEVQYIVERLESLLTAAQPKDLVVVHKTIALTIDSSSTGERR